MTDADQDKTEQPTSHKLEEARKQGQVAKSQDMAAALVMITFALIVGVTASDVANSIASAMTRMIWLATHTPAVGSEFASLLVTVSAPLWRSLFPLLLGLVLAAVIGSLAQTGPMISTQSLKPDINRMNPSQVIGRVMSSKTLWELAKNTFKLFVLGGMCLAFVWRAADFTESVASVPPRKIAAVFLDSFSAVSVRVLGLIAVVAVMDLIFTRRSFLQKMRMSRRDVKEEVKRHDGDPTVKARQRQQIRELVKKTKALANVHRADLVVTNPTHISVALRYRVGETLAPVVIAKGAGFLSAIVRKLATRNGIQVIREPALARALYKVCDIEAMVPMEHYAALAPVYQRVWAEQGRMA